MPSKSEQLQANHDRIIAWRAEGLKWRDIATRLQIEGVKVDHNAVYRYCKRAGIPTDAIEQPPTAMATPMAARETPVAVVTETPSPAKTQIAVVAPTTVMAATVPLPASSFARLDAYRQYCINLLNQGGTLHECWGLFRVVFKMDVSREETDAYIKSLLYELFPPGPIQPELFAIRPPERSWNADSPLVAFGNPKHPANHWKIRDAFEGTVIFGATGSGKTTGSGRIIADEFIANGFGGLVLTTKEGEADDWMKLLARRGRDRDMSRIRCDGLLRINLLEYETTHPGDDANLTDNLVAFYKNLVSVLSKGGRDQLNEGFWRQTGDDLLRNLFECFSLAGEPLTLDALCEFVAFAPTDPQKASDGVWQTIPVFGNCLNQAKASVVSPDDQRAFRVVEQYWLNAYPNLVNETRSCITIAFGAMMNALRGRQIYNLLSNETTITPESIFNGRIIIVDLPINKFHEAGLLVQAAWKYLFQRAVLRRADRGWRDQCRPVFLWEDEAHNFLIDFDAEFQRVARENRVARVMLTQNINNLYDRFGGDGAAQTKVNSILGNLNTRIFHANGDQATNQWASSYFGSQERVKTDISVTPARYPGLNPIKGFVYKLITGPTVTKSHKLVRETVVHPHEFASLKRGGKENNFITEAVVAQVGRTFENGQLFQCVALNQLLLPDKMVPDDVPLDQLLQQ